MPSFYFNKNRTKYFYSISEFAYYNNCFDNVRFFFKEYTWKLVGIAPFMFCQSDFYVTLAYLYLKAKLFQISFQYFSHFYFLSLLIYLMFPMSCFHCQRLKFLNFRAFSTLEKICIPFYVLSLIFLH